MKKTLTEVLSIIKDKDVTKEMNHLVTFLNPYSYRIARKNLDLFQKFDIIYIDGFSLVKLLNLFKIGTHSRKSFDMSSMAGIVFNDAVENNKSVYFIGTEPQKINDAINVIRNNFPAMSIIGFRNGYFKDNIERNEVLQDIQMLKPDIVICGMGTPLQEQFLVDLRNIGWNGTGYTCGGFLHQIIDGIQYFPDWSNKYNLRWLYRMIKEPTIIKRQIYSFSILLFIFISDFFKYKKSNNE